MNEDEKSEKLAHFQELTGIGDLDRCRSTLEHYNWNLEVAVESMLSVDEGEGTMASHSVPEPGLRQRRVVGSLQDITRTQVGRQPVHMVMPVQRHQPWSNWLADIVLLPFRFAFSTVWSIFRFLGALLFPVSQSAINSVGDVIQFISMFEEQYGDSHPQFFRGSYEDAVNAARRDVRFLLVYLHSRDHMHTEQFCREVVCSVGVTEYVNENMIFWGCDVNSNEGYRVSRIMREATYPFLALLCVQDSRMVIVERIEAGGMSVDDVMARLVGAVETNEPLLVAARSDRQQRTESVALREQQDKAYLESLRQDQEKERRQQEEQERIRQEERDQQRKQQQQQDMQELLARQREEKRRSLPLEPDAGSKDSTKVLFRLPDGRRLERRFAKTDTLQVLYDYAFCSEESLQKFVLVSSFPRKELRIESTSNVPTLEEAGLIPSASLFVQNEDTDSD